MFIFKIIKFLFIAVVVSVLLFVAAIKFHVISLDKLLDTVKEKDTVQTAEQIKTQAIASLKKMQDLEMIGKTIKLCSNVSYTVDKESVTFDVLKCTAGQKSDLAQVLISSCTTKKTPDEIIAEVNSAEYIRVYPLDSTLYYKAVLP